MAELHLTGTSAGTILQANNNIASDQTFTFPDTGGELSTTGGAFMSKLIKRVEALEAELKTLKGATK